MSMTMSMPTLELPDGTVIEPSGDWFEEYLEYGHAAVSQQIGVA